MALDINGYSNVFRTFVDFAQQRVDANDENAIADAHVQKPLVGRKTLAITQSLTDEVHKWTRGMDEWTVNDRTRALFRKTFADMAKNIRQLTDFEAGSQIVEGVENVMKENLNEMIEDEIEAAGNEDALHFAHKGDEISITFRSDANRGVYTINGQVFAHASADTVEAAFKQAVHGTANRQGVSTILNQTLPNAFSMIANRAPLAATNKHPDGPDTANVPGIETFVSRNAASGKYMMMTTVAKNGESAHYDFQVAEDGKSATIRVSIKFNLAEGAGANESVMAPYGTVTYGGEYKIDLSDEKPVVTDVKISQKFSETF